VTSSVQNHVYEGGLRYHAFRPGIYAFPNDEVEQHRDDMKHSLSQMLSDGAYFFAPVADKLVEGGEVLDLGTGTGIWAMELGDKYPKTQVTGIDLSPIQPTLVPENVHFYVDDFEEDWVDPENKYDLIHVRHTAHSIRDREALLQRALRHLKPGGYLEFQEFHMWPQCDDDTVKPDTPYALRDFLNYLQQGLHAFGSELHAIQCVAEEMTAAGFVDVTTKTVKCPVGQWAKDAQQQTNGLYLRTAIMDGLPGLSRRPLMRLGWTQLQIEMFLVDVRKHVADGSFHTYYNMHFVYGQKPVEMEEGS